MTTDTETAIQEAEQNTASALMRCVVEQLKVLPRAWQQLSEKEQQEFIDRIETQITTAVEDAINTIHCRSNETIAALVDQVVFKDGVKIVLKVPRANQGAHAIADQEGEMVRIVIPDADDLAQPDDTKPVAEPDQRGLELGHEYADDQKYDGEPFIENSNEEADAALSEALSETDKE